ncbi:MAG TPA: PilN domain-containing protein [Pseudomonas sp.]|uniref:PilN domain-containing protein n=1 Tax=Pseudomonas sp. TaxID=306 RepID=UPI002B45DE7D|nr:PilN domain-containing protein [Pseudomonas sp.]HKS14823.1 PilN domain-containing protein [Pseudomonas sp.]
MLRLNLLPWRERRRLAAVRRFQATLVGAMLVALCGVVFLDQLGRQRLQMQARDNARAQAELVIMDGRLTEIAALEQSYAELNENQALLAGLRAGEGQASALLAQLEQVMPEGLYLSSLQLLGNQVQLEGLAASGTLVVQLIRGLQGERLLHEVDLEQLRSEPKGEGFRLSANIRTPWS